MSISSKKSLHEYRQLTQLDAIGPCGFRDDVSVQQLGKQDSVRSIISSRLPAIKVTNRSLVQSMVASPNELKLSGQASPGAWHLRFSLDRKQPSVS